MGEKEEIVEFIYENKSLVLKSIIGTIITMVIAGLIIGNNIKIVSLTFNMIIIMGSFTIIFLVLSTMKVYDKNYLNGLIFSNLVYVVIAFLYYFKVYELNGVMDIPAYLKSAAYTNFIVVFVMDIKFEVFVKEEFDKSYVKRSCIILIVSLILYKFPGQYLGEILLIILTIQICLKYLYSFKEYRLIVKEKINYIKLNIYLLLSVEILLLINCVFGPYNNILLAVIYILIIVFVIRFICIVDKVVNNPYKNLFKNLYEETSELSIVNKKLNENNQELERNQIKVKRKERMFELFFKKAPVAILKVNVSNRRVVYCNGNFLNIIGENNIKDVINRKFESIVSVNEEVCNMDTDILYSGYVKKNGQNRNVEIRMVDINEENEIVILLVYDSTEKRKIEETKEKIRKELLEEEIKREFLSNITHDLKTPVNVIYSATQLVKILIENQNIEEISKYNFISKQNCKSLISLTNNLIDSSKIDSNYMKPNLKPLNIVYIIENTVESLAEYAKINKIDIIFDTNCEEVICNMDEEFLTRIITNLVSNSIKFTDENGEIIVGVENLFNGWVKVEVVDNGVGMDDYFLKIAFERYAIDREEGNKVTGTGIGLFVVKKFVDILDGQIRIDSVVGVGTKIQMLFKVVG